VLPDTFLMGCQTGTCSWYDLVFSCLLHSMFRWGVVSSRVDGRHRDSEQRGLSQETRMRKLAGVGCGLRGQWKLRLAFDVYLLSDSRQVLSHLCLSFCPCAEWGCWAEHAQPHVPGSHFNGMISLTQGIRLARQVVYCLNHITSLDCIWFGLFLLWDRVSQ
jgi:hypothetical protein